jgi:hypothetical protein
LVSAYQSTRCRGPQDLFLPQLRCEISQPLGCIQVGSLAFQELPCTIILGIIRTQRKLRQPVGSTTLPYFSPSSLRECSCDASLCFSHSPVQRSLLDLHFRVASCLNLTGLDSNARKRSISSTRMKFHGSTSTENYSSIQQKTQRQVQIITDYMIILSLQMVLLLLLLQFFFFFPSSF